MSAAMKRGARAAFCMVFCVLAISCGGSGDDAADSLGVSSSSGSGSSGSSGTSGMSGSNVANVMVNSGPENNSVNTLYVSVTVCVPGTTNCQTIDNVEVDTGSYGLRILSSALTLSLPIQKLSNGSSLLECTNFVQGYSWGPVAAASVQVGGEIAASVPVQIIGDANFTTVPEDCTGLGTAVNTVSDFGANAILGIGPFAEDCGLGCAAQAEPTTYYACPSTGDCVATSVAASAQVQNPVSLFPTDNNGVIIQLPSVPAEGAATLSGYLIFGIDTESNNASGSETVLTVDNEDDLAVTFNGSTLRQSFIDSGTNGIFFNDSDLSVCTQSGLTDFYCPSATASLSAMLTSSSGVTATFQFNIANTLDLLNNNPSFTAFGNLGGTYPGSTSSFDLGLPFYYGQRVATAIEGNTTTVGTGPYFAF